MEGQRQQYIPAPPPPSIAQSSQSHLMSLPPPPPPRHPPTQSQGVVPPPPPGPPPGTNYAVSSGWQQNWGRQALPQGFPPPPPPPPLAPPNQPQNQHLAYSRQPAPLSIPPPPPSESQPLTSATYIPAGESFGPGVGIPPLFDSHSRTMYDSYGHMMGNDRPRTTAKQSYENLSVDGSPYRRDGSMPPTPSSRNVPSSLVLHDNVHELVSPGLPTATLQNSQPQATTQGADLSKSSSHRHNNSSTSLGGMSPSEAAIQWPLDRVLLWLARNGFSRDWQETFKALELEGADFLELGHGSNGRGNLGKMHQVVYPQLAKECGRSGTGWDQAREREEGKRMRKLIRQIHDHGSHESGIPIQKRRESQPLAASAPSDAGSEISPHPGHDPLSATSGTGTVENSPGPSFTLKAPSFNQRHSVQQLRSVTLPIPTSHDPSSFETHPSESTMWPRSEYSRNVLSSIGGDHRRQSPSVSSDSGPFAAPSARPYEESPKSGSPATQHASLAQGGLTSSSTGDLTVQYEHSRGNSSDSTMGIGRGISSTMGRYYETRKQQDSARPSPHDLYNRQWSGETSATYSKEHSKSFLNIFKKRPKIPDSNHPSPEEQCLESPTSPVNLRQNGPHLPFMKPSFNASDMSLGERPSSASMSDHEKLAMRAKPVQKGKKWIFVTLDGWNYRLVDVTDIDSVEALRSIICESLGILDWTSAQIFLTEPGQIDHDEPMNDTALAVCRRTKADSVGSVKLLVRGTHSGLNGSPHFAGLGVSIPAEKIAASPTTGPHQLQRKPLDDEALSRISPHTQVRPASPSPGSRQPALKTSAKNLASRDTSQASLAVPSPDGTPEAAQSLDPEKADLLARHEEYKREVERKQKAYRLSKQPTQQPKKEHYGDTGYRREGVIDFDSPRISPYEDKKAEPLVPLRKPPSAPSESSTLTKVNSLSKRNIDRARVQPSVQTHGLGAVLASVGRMTSAIGTPSPSVPVPPAGSNLREGANSEGSRTTPVDRTTPRFTPEQEHPNTPSRHAEPVSAKGASSEEPPRPTLQSRKSYGPEFDFEETKVAFQNSPGPQEYSDEDSDDGLFAIPLANSKTQAKGNKSTPASPETLKKSEKPALTVNTDSRLRKGLSVSFKSPSTTGESLASSSTHNSGGEKNEPRMTFLDTENGPETPHDERPPPRRDSFARGDVWASRPPVEGVIDNLDDFFPDIDLDAPYLEGHTASPPSSPASKVLVEGEASFKDKQESIPYAAQPSHAASDTLGSDESTLKAKEANIVARRNINRSGGLSRMKSIREVAKGANQFHRNRSIHNSGNQRSGDILRRKSTKMFGAKIMQISPKPGSRLSQLDPIPQNNPPLGHKLQRQPTFRIIRGQLIGKGTYGRVYLGINADTGEVLAVKQVEINPRLAGQDTDRIKEMVAAMDQEIDTMQHLEHPNIVQYLGCERGELSISIYLEYISGGSIGSCLRKHGKFEESVVKSLTRQTLSGLAYLHDQGILHRDMKADNILLDLDGTCKISDFGISKKTDNIYGNDSTNSMQGSVFWMAPEVIQSQGQGYSAKVDIWSLGCVVLEMFAGRRPWSKEEAIGAIFKLGSLNQAPPIPEDVSMNISPAALAFMYDCFTVDSLDRPTAETLLTRHPFCEPDPNYNFLDTELYAKIRHVL